MEEAEEADDGVEKQEPPKVPPSLNVSKVSRDAITPEALAAKERRAGAKANYGRGKAIPIKRVKDKKLRANLRAVENKYRDATLKARDAEILHENEAGFLEPENELEKTHRTRQDDIRQDLGLQTAKKGFEVKLAELGPYVAEYSRNGRHLLLAGRAGHVATMDWREGSLECEIQLQETVRDAKWLYNNQSFAVAQKENVYIYDSRGVELHNLRHHIDVTHMEYLPYHFLLATAGKQGVLKYTDISTGSNVAEFPTKQGRPTAFGQNSYNAILHVGHQNGTVSLWSPNSTSALAKLLAHRGPVRSLAVDREGRYMVTTGQDRKMGIWDIRMFREIHEDRQYYLRHPGSSLAISDRNLAAVGWGTQVSIWKDLFRKSAVDQEKVQRPYMAWGGDGQHIERLRWCPFEDILGVSHAQGFASMIVPGAGEPNIDAREINPFETTKQRQESEVRSLLNKLPSETISLNPDFVGNLDLASAETQKRERDLDRPPDDPIAKLKNRGKGKNSSLRKYLRKKGQKNVIDDRRLRIQDLLKSQNKKEGDRLRQQEEEFGPALARFARKTN